MDWCKNVVSQLLTFVVSGLMITIRKVSPDGTHSAVKKILPAWNALIYNLGKLTPENEVELRKSAKSLLLNIIPAEARTLIPSLEKRKKPVSNTWAYQNDEMVWDIGFDELVLDIGFGGWPFKRANHLADRYPENTSHRTEALARDERPFFEADIENLPFNDQTYDYIFCSHVLEHLDNPGQAIRELMRVGDRGYIEVPTRLSDIMLNFTRLPDHHRWHGMVFNDTLILIEWNDSERRNLGNYYFNLLHSEYENNFQEFFERNRDLFFASCHWERSIKFMIINKKGVIIDSSGEGA